MQVRQLEASGESQQLLAALKDIRSQLQSIQQHVHSTRVQLQAVQSRVDELSSKVSNLIGNAMLLTGGILSTLTAVAGYNSIRNLLNRTW